MSEATILRLEAKLADAWDLEWPLSDYLRDNPYRKATDD